MVGRVEVALVKIWGLTAGAVAWDANRRLATFEFEPAFLDHGLDLAPLKMPLADARRGATRYAFAGLSEETFRGLPGLLADALPDLFGNALIDAWLARQGRDPADFSPIERLCYTGRRAVGALEFEPAVSGLPGDSVPVQVGELAALAQEILTERQQLQGRLTETTAGGDSAAMLDILRVGTSAGGGRPKAVVAIDDKTGEIRSGQVAAPEGFSHWLLKFDGVQEGGLGDPAGYGRIEYAYYQMARAAGIEMVECRLLEEGGRAHFTTRRFDRPSEDDKLHMQSLCAMGHFDFNTPGGTSYEQAFQVMRTLGLPYQDAEQMFLRMVFNVVARNQDDHTKNIAFLMDRTGRWRLSPAFDLTWAYNPEGKWTRQHQMSIGGKRSDLQRADLLALAVEMNIKKPAHLVDQVIEAVAGWWNAARDAGVEPRYIETIGKAHQRL